MIYLIYYKNLCKCHNVPPPIITIKEKEIVKNKKIKLTVIMGLECKRDTVGVVQQDREEK
jgi:hypothetical protein